MIRFKPPRRHISLGALGPRRKLIIIYYMKICMNMMISMPLRIYGWPQALQMFVLWDPLCTISWHYLSSNALFRIIYCQHLLLGTPYNRVFATLGWGSSHHSYSEWVSEYIIPGLWSKLSTTQQQLWPLVTMRQISRSIFTTGLVVLTNTRTLLKLRIIFAKAEKWY